MSFNIILYRAILSLLLKILRKHLIQEIYKILAYFIVSGNISTSLSNKFCAQKLYTGCKSPTLVQNIKKEESFPIC